jgi:uncharacterized membrane protein
MKQLTVGVFASRSNAEEAINRIHNELHVPNDDISFVYRNTDGEVKEVNADDVSTDTTAEGAGKGAAIGATIGVIAGLATVAGIIPVFGPLFAAGPLAAALGLTGAVGTAAAGAATGAAAGGIIGALTHLGVGEEHAQHYADLVQAGDILVTVYAEESAQSIFIDCGALEAEAYTVQV